MLGEEVLRLGGLNQLVAAHELHVGDQQVRALAGVQIHSRLHQVPAKECALEELLCRWDMTPRHNLWDLEPWALDLWTLGPLDIEPSLPLPSDKALGIRSSWWGSWTLCLGLELEFCFWCYV